MEFPCTRLVWLSACSACGQWDGNWALQVWSSWRDLGLLPKNRVTSWGCSKSSHPRGITHICGCVELLGHDTRCLGGGAGGCVLWTISPPDSSLEYLHSQVVTMFLGSAGMKHRSALMLRFQKCLSSLLLHVVLAQGDVPQQFSQSWGYPSSTIKTACKQWWASGVA